MSTYMQKPADLVRKWYILDAQGKPLGRVAAAAADILRGKHKPTFTPHVDCGDYVIVLNAEKAVLTGKKLEKKYYHYHTGFIGGIKSIQYKRMMSEKPEMAMTVAVKGMLARTRIGRKSMTRLLVYKGNEHKHEAQKPEVYNI